MRIRWLALGGVAVAPLLVTPDAARSFFEVVHYEKATIADIHAALSAKTLTCRALVQMYLDRIAAYDKKGPALNAIVVTNPEALKLADTLDARFVQSGPVGPLHCVPLIVKDNYETTDMPTSAGSLSLKGVMSKTDAFQIKKLREAGAIMLAKSNMAEFAFDPMETVNSLMPGYTRNPYALDRVTAGSSGGTAAAVAANFGAAGHRQLDPRTGVAHQPGRHPLDHGADEPRRHRAAVPRQGRRRADGAHCCRCRGDLRRDRRLRSGRSGHRGQPGQAG